MTRVNEIDWERWRPVDRATLLFVLAEDRVLLIRKKRGLGAGKMSAPGGRIEPGETPLEGAIREVVEEIGVTPTEVEKCGELRFQFVDGHSIHCHVFVARGWEGVPVETDEAEPRWTPLSAIPYAEMWADDALWLPMLLAGDTFDGRFVFDGDAMLDHHIEPWRDKRERERYGHE